METIPDIYKFMHLFIKTDIIIINRDAWTDPYRSGSLLKWHELFTEFAHI